MLVQQDCLPQAAQGLEGRQEVEAVAGSHQPDAGDEREMFLHPQGQKRNVTTPTRSPFLAPAHLVSGLCLSLSNSSGTLMAATEPVHSTSTFTMTLDHHDSALTLVSGTRLMGRL